MVITAILTAAAVLVSNLIILLIIKTYIYGMQTRIIALAKSYFETTDPAEPSQFAKFCDILADIFAKHITQNIKSSFMGMQSVDSKNEKRLQADLFQDIASAQSPILGAIMQSFPSVGKRLAKNPELLPMVQNLMAKIGGSAASKPGNNGHDESDYSSRLNKYR
jgi:hypothetical protein